jgi:hypothetical protein
MGRRVAVVLYVVAMAAVIVGVDLVFFRNRFLERLTANVGIVFLMLVLGGGGGYYSHTRWGFGGGAGVVLGTILLILLIDYMLGLFR